MTQLESEYFIQREEVVILVPVAELTGGASGGNCPLPFTKETLPRRPLFGGTCALHLDRKILTFNCFDQNLEQTYQS